MKTALKIIELKIEHCKKRLNKFRKVGNSSAMKHYECRIETLEDLLEDLEEYK